MKIVHESYKEEGKKIFTRRILIEMSTEDAIRIVHVAQAFQSATNFFNRLNHAKAKSNDVLITMSLWSQFVKSLVDALTPCNKTNATDISAVADLVEVLKPQIVQKPKRGTALYNNAKSEEFDERTKFELLSEIHEQHLEEEVRKEEGRNDDQVEKEDSYDRDK